MPYKTVTEEVPAKLAYRWKGVAVYHAYDDDDFDQPLEYYFVMQENFKEEDAFDVRDLPEWKHAPIPDFAVRGKKGRKAWLEWCKSGERKHKLRTIRKAIENKTIRFMQSFNK